MTNQTCVSPAHASTGTPDHTNSAVVVCPLYTYAQSECSCMRTYALGHCLCMCWIISLVHVYSDRRRYVCMPAAAVLCVLFSADASNETPARVQHVCNGNCTSSKIPILASMFACPPPRCCVCCVYACSVFWLPVCIPVCRWYAFAGILVGMHTIACLI